MTNDSITFACPACGIKLTVPATLAGVIGPCPSCGTQIQAPNIGPTAPMPVMNPPAQPETLAPQPQTASIPQGLKPEPRQLPQRFAPVEVSAKPMPEPSSSPITHKTTSVPRHPHKPGVLTRIMMLLVFGLLALALVYGVLTILNQQEESKPTPPIKSSVPAPVKQPSAPVEKLPEKAPETPIELPTQPAPPLPTPPPAQPELSPETPNLPESIEAKSMGQEAIEVLEKFLTAKSLAEREPLIETKHSKEDLSNTCLTGPLPPARSMIPEYRETNLVEGVVDFYHRVDFGTGEAQSNPHFILVRRRGTSSPKVVVEPFLDLFGGRLAAYVSQPSDKAGYFHVIAYPLPSCTDITVPGHEKKQALRLLAADTGKEIAKAYFGKQSKIAAMLMDGSHNLSYGNAKVCTVLLHWNTEDKPDRPYLEAGDITALNWNP